MINIKTTMFVMIKKFHIIIKSNNVLHMENVHVHVDLFMLTNKINMIEVSHKV